MSTCAAPAGSPCRTGKGRVAVQYHTARFRLVPSLAKALTVATPALRRPGSAWVELPRPATADAEPAGHARIGYARASTVRQSLDTQLDSLTRAKVGRVFAEKISTRALRRPELDNAVALAQEMRASGVAVTLVVHEHKRLGRGIELATLAEQLRAAGIGLEFLTGELQGSHDPAGIVFTVLAALSGMEREYIRDRTLEGHESARARGKSIGGAAVTDEAMLSHALHLRDQQHLSLRDIATRLVITKGKKKGQHPSPATVLRLLRDHDEHAAPSTTKLDAVDEIPTPSPALLSLAGSRHSPPVAAVDDLSGLRPIPARMANRPPRPRSTCGNGWCGSGRRYAPRAARRAAVSRSRLVTGSSSARTSPSSGSTPTPTTPARRPIGVTAPNASHTTALRPSSVHNAGTDPWSPETSPTP